MGRYLGTSLKGGNRLRVSPLTLLEPVDHDPAAVRQAAAGSSERWLWRGALVLILLALALRLLMLVHAKLGEDEAEHLHAAWAVAQGQVPYRDFWQLHPPLLYYLMAPAFALMGEDLRIIYVGRGLMLVCIVLIFLWLYRIARDSFDALTAMLAVLLLIYLLAEWGPSYSFRPDIPQTLIVLVSIQRFMSAWKSKRRIDLLVSGALLGVGFWLVAKTLFPLVGLTLVFAVSSCFRRSRLALMHNLQGAVLFLSAFAVPVLIGALLLWYEGAFPQFLRWAVIKAFLYPERFSPFRYFIEVHGVFTALALWGVVQAVARMVRARVVDEFQLSPLLACLVTAAVFLFLMPAPHRQSALPFLPLAAMYGAGVLRRVIARALPSGTSGPQAPNESAIPFVRSPARLAWGGLAALLLYGVCVPPVRALGSQPLQDRMAYELQKIRYVLALTSPDDSVFDPDGRYIFRPHATYYYRLGNAVIMWLHSGVIPEMDIINDLQKSHCKLVMTEPRLNRLPPDLLRFLKSHYVATGSYGVAVAGRVFQRTDLAGTRATVSLVASAEYAVRTQGGEPRVHIDGRLYRVPLFLAQGEHMLLVEGDFQTLEIFYSRVLSVPSWLHEAEATERPDRAIHRPSQGDAE